jgi:hypothetical protein
MVSSAKLASHSVGVRSLFSRQLLLVVVAAALYFAILWIANVRGAGMGLVPIILYTLLIGNLTTPIMNLHALRFSAHPLAPFSLIPRPICGGDGLGMVFRVKLLSASRVDGELSALKTE